MNQRSSVDFVDLLLQDVVDREVSPETRADLYSLPKTRYDQTHERTREAVSRTRTGDVINIRVKLGAVEGMIRESLAREMAIEDARTLFMAAASRDLVHEITRLDRRKLTEIRESMDIGQKRAPRALRPTVMEQQDIQTVWFSQDREIRLVKRLVLVATETQLHVSMVWAGLKRIIE